MSDTKIILKAVVDGQKSLKQELLGRIDQTEKMLFGKIDQTEKMLFGRVDKSEKMLFGRVDKSEKMLRAVINGQSSLKGELLQEIKKVQSDLNDHRKETKTGFKAVSERIDKIGKAVAYLEDDAPTNEEFDKLEERVVILEQASLN